MKKIFIGSVLGFAVMSLTGMSAVSAPPNTQILDDILDQLTILDGKLNDKLEIRFPSVVNYPLDGTTGGYQVRVFCDRAFQVTGVYSTVRDPEGSVDFTYNSVLALNNIFDSSFTPPTSWAIEHNDFTVVAQPESAGYELLSQLEVDKPVGIADGGSFDILGTRDPNTGNTTITIGAVVETAQDPENECEIVIVDH